MALETDSLNKRTLGPAIGSAVVGIALGVIQSGTSAPFAAGMVLISFAESPWWSKLLQILFFAVIAILPSTGLIIALSRVPSGSIGAASRRIDRFLSYGRVAGRVLTLVVGVALTVLADEVLTPDSSRFWPASSYEPGRAQPSYDKQIVRNWLTSAASGWDRSSDDPPPSLPADVVERTRARYIEAYELISQKSFDDWPDHA